MSLAVTPLYAGLIALLMAVLSTRVGFLRGRYGVALGDGGQRQLTLAIRHFGNLSEYAAMAVVVLGLLELTGTAPVWLHAYGIALLAFRVIHVAVLFDTMDAPGWKKAGRGLAAAGTAGLLALGGGALVVSAL